VFTLLGADQSYRMLIEDMNEGALTLTAQGLILYANQRAADMVKAPLHKVIGTSIDAWIAPEAGDVLRALLQAPEGGDRRGELALVTSDGARMPAYVSVNRLRMDEPAEIFCVVVTDLTEQKRSQEIVASERLARAILDQVDEAIVVCDRSGTVFRASRMAHALCDASPLGLPFERAFPVRTPDGQPVQLARASLGQGLHQVEVTLSRGEQLHHLLISARNIVANRDDPLGCVVVLTDITALKQAEESLRRLASRLRYLHVTDQEILAAIASPEEVAQAALRHVRSLLCCQRASVGLFDAAMKEARVIGVESESDPETESQFGRVLPIEAFEDLDVPQAEGMQSRVRVPLASANQLSGVLSLDWDTPRALSPEELDIAREVAGQIALAIEQSRLRAEARQYAADLEQRVADRTAELQFANKELESFTYTVSHDLRAPLRAINGFSRILLEEYAPLFDDEGKRLCAVIGLRARNMGQLIDDLLSFSRIGRAVMLKSPFDMAALAKSAFQDITSPAGRERIDFSVGALPCASGDPSLLRQVWLNLLSNAVKYSSKKQRAVIEVSAARVASEVVYTVRDNGVGFDMRYANKLFGVFQRLHSADEFEGTGVGLAIVQRIIQRHNGRVWAEAAIGQGAAFHFALPANC
jgi:PAS domain S-box-containing protein